MSPEKKKTKMEGEKAGKDESCGLVGSEFLAEVPDWSVITSESDSKWFDTLILPLNIE
ncbi:hypothetical protein YC2023_063795 [Brassica napus]